MLDNKLYAGSDEVGTGEYFGPIIVVALSFNSIEDKNYAKEIGVKDSKLLTNKKINEISELLKDKVSYSAKIFTPLDYHDLDPKYNLNHVKFKLHIEAHKSLNSSNERVIDKFASDKSMYKYSSDLGVDYNDGDYILEEKAESKFLEVAAAAIIAKRIWNEWMSSFLKEEGLNFDFDESFSVQLFHQSILDGDISIKNKKGLMKPWPINEELLK